MTEHVPQDALPACAVEKSGVGAAQNERIPARRGGRIAFGQALHQRHVRREWDPGFHDLPVGLCEDDFVDASPPKVGEQASEPSLRAAEIDVVTKPRFNADTADAWLRGVDLPRMKKEDGRLPVDL